LLLVLFVGSGCAALIYEIVWLQLLQLVIGSSAVSLGVLLGTFMGGMCLGSLLLPRLVTAGRHPLRVYGILELGIGLIGVAVLLAMPHVDRLYAAVGAQGAAGLWLRVAVCTACLLPPTALMGATLPAVARWVESTPAGAARLGLFYGGNIAGAVLGCLLAGFYLLRVHDVAVATYVAAGINGVVGLIGLALAARVPHAGAGTPGPAGATGASAPALPSPPPSPRLVYLVIGLSGLCALAAEVVWTRVLSLLLGATVYTFSIILAVFLTGLGIGTAVGSALARRVANPRRALGWCQALAVAAVAWSAYAVARSLPYWPIEGEATENVWFGFGRDLLRCAWALLPPTVMWGASFPLALAAATARGRDPGRVAGGVYAANTVGAIVGAVAASVWLIPTIGTRNVQRGVILLAAVAAALAFAARGGPAPAARSNPPAARRRPAPATAALLLAALTAAAAALAWRVPKIPDLLIAYGRSTLTAPEVGPDSAMARDLRFLFVGEGVSSSVAVTDWHGLRHFHVSGKVEASSQWQDMRVQRMLGHLPALVHPRPASVLVVGCGAGVTAGSFVVHPEVERIVICEIEPLIPRVVARHFAEENHGVLSDPRLTIVYDDARHYVLTTRERFDVITSDPIHPWVKGAASLYTREYFEMCRARLNPGGVFVQWVPLYESTPDAVKSELATFFEVFPHGTVWANDLDGEGYDVVLLGQDAPSVIDLDEIQLRRVGRRDRARVAASLQQVGFGSAAALFATYAGRGPDLREWLAGAAINRDRNLRLQYIAGMGRGQQRGSQIYHQMLAHRRFPRDLFAESELYGEALRQWMGEAGAE
jgi:spermidine synthase